MKITVGEMIRLLIVGAVVTVVVFFRCKSILKEKDQPSQHHVTPQERTETVAKNINQDGYHCPCCRNNH